MDKCPKCNSETKIASAKKRLAYARQWTEYAAICCTNTKCCWSIELSVYNTIRAEARAEALKEIPKVCGNCIHGRPTSLDSVRCFKSTPYTPTGLHCIACNDWEQCRVKENPRAAITQELPSGN